MSDWIHHPKSHDSPTAWCNVWRRIKTPDATIVEWGSARGDYYVVNHTGTPNFSSIENMYNKKFFSLRIGPFKSLDAAKAAYFLQFGD